MARRPVDCRGAPLSVSFALASAAHVAVVAWLAWRSPRERPAASTFRFVPSLEVALDEGPAPPHPPNVAFESNDPSPGPAVAPKSNDPSPGLAVAPGSNATSPGPVAAFLARPRSAAPARPTETPPSGGPAPASEGPPAPSVGGPEAAPRDFSLGRLPPSFAWGDREALPGPRAAPTLAPSTALRDAITQGEQARGLTASGPLVAAARAAASIAAAPAEGSATFRIDVGTDGSVNSVTADHGAWKATASALRSALAGRRLRVPPGAAGVSVELRVDARITNAPRLLTGEEKVKPCSQARGRLPWGGSPDTTPTNTGCIDATALLPLRRRLVSVALLRETSL